MNYKIEIIGTAANDQVWDISHVMIDGPRDMAGAVAAAIGIAFDRLTRGKAVYGQPGTSCQGPYTITRILIQKCGGEIAFGCRAKPAWWNQRRDRRQRTDDRRKVPGVIGDRVNFYGGPDSALLSGRDFRVPDRRKP